MKVKLLLLAVTVLARVSSAEGQEYSFGSALTQGIGGVVTLVPSSAAVASTSPALMSFAESKTSAELSYRQLCDLDALQDVAAHARKRFGRLGTGFSLTRFGQSGLYQEYGLTIAASYLLRPMLGVGAALQYTSAEFGDGQSRYSGGELAISAACRPNASVLISGTIRGVTLDQLYDGIETDAIYEGSIAWKSPSEVSLGAIWTRQRQGDHRFALGQILNLTQNLHFLSGLRFDPVRYTLGGRAIYQGMTFAYAYEGHPELGPTHSFGIALSH